MKLTLLGFVVCSLSVAATKSDCQCFNGFDPDVMPKMNITDFEAAAYLNGTSIYSFDLAYWPGLGLAHCKATLQGASGVFVPVGGDQYCASKVDGNFLPIWWFWNQSWPDAEYELRAESKYIGTAGFCVECLEYGSHIVSAGDLKRSQLQVEYQGRRNFAIRPRTVHG